MIPKKMTLPLFTALMISTLMLAGCASAGKPTAGYAAAGEIHPSQNRDWCLSTSSHPEAGDSLFIAECGEPGTRQQWDAERVAQKYTTDLGFISLLGTTLVISNDGYLTILADTSNVKSQWAGLTFVPRDISGITAWEVTIPWFHHRPMSTAMRLKMQVHYSVFWYTGNDNNWLFPPWAAVEIPAAEATHVEDAG
jgi:uncharacterized protein YcfL